MELVSIIVPIYNVEPYIEKCILSIIGQTYSELEIILVDDGSPDNCGNICLHYAAQDKRIKVIQKENGGLSDARNAGIRQATGKYLLFVDGDDSIVKDLVEKAAAIGGKTDAEIVIFDYMSIESDTNRQDSSQMDLPHNELISVETNPKLLIIPQAAWNKLYRRDFWLGTGLFYPEGKNFEDLQTTPKLLLLAEKIVYLKSEPLYNYALREGSIMRSNNFEKNYKDRTASIDSVLEFFETCGKYELYKKELEYLTFENTYFVPSKEIVLADRKSPVLNKFKEYAFGKFPRIEDNPYIQNLSGKDKLLFLLLKRKNYRCMQLLSKVRKMVDTIKGH